MSFFISSHLSIFFLKNMGNFCDKKDFLDKVSTYNIYYNLVRKNSYKYDKSQLDILIESGEEINPEVGGCPIMLLRGTKSRSNPLKTPENRGIAMRPLDACNDKKGIVGHPLKRKIFLLLPLGIEII